jgi:hypothetical protein
LSGCAEDLANPALESRRMLTTILARYARRIVLSCAALLLGCCSLDTSPSLGRHVLETRPVGSDTSLDGHLPGLAAAADAAAEKLGDASLPATGAGLLDAAASTQGQMPDAHLSDAADGRDASNTNAADAKIPNATDASTPKTDAAANRSCRAGGYTGAFSCMVDPTGVTPLTAMAQVTFTLQQASSGTLTVTNSNLAFDLTGYVFAGDLSGSFDCATGVFHADIINGIFTAVLLPIPESFTGAIDGQIDNATSDLSGTWSFSASGGGPACTGPWNASLQP